MLKREFELAMLDTLVAHAQANGAREIIGAYIRTAKNGLVVDHYEKLGFECARIDDHNASTWRLDLSQGYHPKTSHIKIEAPQDVSLHVKEAANV